MGAPKPHDHMLSDGPGHMMLVACRLDAAHGIVIEKAGVAGPAFEVPEPFNDETVIQAAILNRMHHPHRAAFRAGQWFRHPRFFWRK